MAINFPDAPANNDVFTVGNKSWKYDSTTGQWNAVTLGLGYTIADTAPSSPKYGDTWFNSSTGKTYVWYDNYWVEMTGAFAGAINNASATIAGSVSTGTQTFAGDKTFTGSFTAANYDVAGKNKIINGGMDIWQRGTAAIGGAGSATSGFLADRWQCYRASYGINSYINYITTSNLPGFSTCLRFGRNTGDTTTNFLAISQTLESKQSIPLAGQTVTYSFYARVGANFSGTGLYVAIVYGTGTDQNITSGFTGQTNLVAQTFTNMSTSWQRFSITGVVPTNATQIAVTMSYTPVGTAPNGFDYFDITGAQLERGSVATPFSRAGGTIQGELAACQRYYVRFGGLVTYEQIAYGLASATNAVDAQVILPVTMRIPPSGTAPEFANLRISDGQNTFAVSSVTSGSSGVQSSQTKPLFVFAATGLTQFRPYRIETNNTLAGYLGISAEL